MDIFILNIIEIWVGYEKKAGSIEINTKKQSETKQKETLHQAQTHIYK